MAQTAVAAKIAEPEAKVAAVARNLDPNDCSLLETVERRFRIILPEGAGVADLNENRELFKWLQSGPAEKRLQRLDFLRIEDAGQTFICEAYVDSADNTSVTLTRPRVIQLTPPKETLSPDGRYSVRWTAKGFAVFRVADNRRVTQPRPERSGAIIDMNGLVPRHGSSFSQ